MIQHSLAFAEIIYHHSKASQTNSPFTQKLFLISMRRNNGTPSFCYKVSTALVLTIGNISCQSPSVDYWNKAKIKEMKGNGGLCKALHLGWKELLYLDNVYEL